MRLIQAGAVDQSITFRALTSAGATATPAFGDAGIAATYKRDATGAATAITLVTQTSTGAHSDGGLVHIGGGVCRLDLPDAAVADGATRVTVTVNATAWVGFVEEILLVDYDPTGDTAGTTTLLSRLSSARAGYLDNLSAGAVALQSTLATLATTVSGLAAAVWAYATRTLTMTAAQIAAILDGTALTVHRGDTLSQSITGLGSISGRLALWLTVKENPQSDADSASKVQLTEAAGLTYLNGAVAVTAGDGSLVVTSAAAGDVTVTLAAAATAALVGGKVYSYDIQVKDASGAIRTIAEGLFRVVADVTRATT